jgi:acyl dehydratase
MEVDMSTDTLRALGARLEATKYRDASYTISDHDIARFARALGSERGIYYNKNIALQHGYPGIVAPRSFYMALGTSRGRLVPGAGYAVNGLPAEEDLDGVRLVVGETSVVFAGEIYAGDTVRVEQDVREVAEREGRSGRFLTMQLERRYEGRNGPLVTERITRIVR